MIVKYIIHIWSQLHFHLKVDIFVKGHTYWNSISMDRQLGLHPEVQVFHLRTVPN